MKFIITDFVVGTFYFIVLFLIEFSNNSSFLKHVPHLENQNANEQLQELNKIMNNDSESDHSVFIKNLSKIYDGIQVVKGISLKADKNECLVVLGTNGCGKTTTFKCITGECSPNGGQVFINGVDLHENKQIARKTIG